MFKLYIRRTKVSRLSFVSFFLSSVDIWYLLTSFCNVVCILWMYSVNTVQQSIGRRKEQAGDSFFFVKVGKICCHISDKIWILSACSELCFEKNCNPSYSPNFVSILLRKSNTSTSFSIPLFNDQNSAMFRPYFSQQL